MGKNKKQKSSSAEHMFSLTLANGKTQTFESGYEMWKWATSVGKGWEFYDVEGPPVKTLSEWFENRRNRKS